MSNKHLPYNVADIQRYLLGGMSNSEMRQLELAALSDPFLQDAIDGFAEAYATYSPAEIEPSLQVAESFERLTGKKKKEAIVIPIWRRKLVQYAVAATVVLGSGWYIFNLSQPESKLVNNEAAHDVTATTTDTVAASKPANVIAPEFKLSEPQQVATNTNKQAESNLSKAKSKAVKPVDVPPPVYYDTEEKSENTVASKNDDIAMNQHESERDSITIVPVTPPAKSNAFVQKAPAESLQGKISGLEVSSNLISGKITDTDKYPLDNITLQVKGSRRAVLSDELGRFQIAIPDSAATLVASGMGYKSKEFRARANVPKMELQLEPSAQSLSEVVVTGYGTRKKTAVNEVDTTEAAPATGWQNFETYLLQNKKLNRTGKRAVTVIMSFEVNENGRPGEFDIIQSGGVAFDNEAIRLLKAGPLWKNKTSDSTAMAKITIVF